MIAFPRSRISLKTVRSKHTWHASQSAVVSVPSQQIWQRLPRFVSHIKPSHSTPSIGRASKKRAASPIPPLNPSTTIGKRQQPSFSGTFAPPDRPFYRLFRRGCFLNSQSALRVPRPLTICEAYTTHYHHPTTTPALAFCLHSAFCPSIRPYPIATSTLFSL